MENIRKEESKDIARLMIKLTPTLKKRLKATTADLGLTMSEFLRDVISRALENIEAVGGYNID